MIARRARAGALAGALCAAALVGGCDGGLFGTGGEDAGSAAQGDAAESPSGFEAQAPDGDGGSTPEGGDAAVAPTDPIDPAPQEDSDEGVSDGGEGGAFVNDLPTHGGAAPLLRTANLTARAVRVVASGSAAEPIAVAAGAVTPTTALDGTVDSLAVTDAFTLAPLARTAARLSPGTLTLLLVVPDADGGALAAPFVAAATGPEGGVAAVRVIRTAVAAASGAPAGIELRPAGDDPGGAAVRFEPAPDGAGGPVAATDYTSVAPGDYALVDGADEGASPGPSVAFEAGRAYSLILTGAPDGAAPIVIVDSDLDGAADGR